jgi:hypothetical protein
VASPNNTAAEFKRLRTLTDGAERNALALRLAEARTPGLQNVLIEMIGREDLRSNRGTLIHCLGHYDCSAYLNFLLALVIDGGFEVASEALQIIDLIEAIDGEEAELAFASATEALARPDLLDWRREMLEEILEMFEVD